ncbi:hypothetical protein [Streptomyces cyaneofuscatus]|uniref:hypothetical protein n=1 Tax=Streptomyces cyaneofuscatus TaxID=66883 RepID=UPI00364C60EB
MDEVEVVVAHSERATLRVGDVFLKVDADQARIDAEVDAMSLAPVPTPQVLWREPPVLAIAVAGYGADADLDVIHAWWSVRSLLAVRWLTEHGFDPFAPGCEVDVLRSRM